MTYTKEEIKEYMQHGSQKATADKWLVKGLVAIFTYQTASEQAWEETTELNGVGFSGADAEILSSFAKQVQAGRAMSQKQMFIIRKKMPKYAGQLAKIANGEQ